MSKVSIFIPMAILIAGLGFSCTPTVAAKSTPTLSLTYTKTLAGYTLSATETPKLVMALGAKGLSDITFAPSSSDSTRVATDLASISGKVAFLDITNGNVTPLGSTSTTITVVATDSTSGLSGSIEVPIDVIAFASKTGKVWNCATADGVYAGMDGVTTVPSTYGSPFAGDILSMAWTISANCSATPNPTLTTPLSKSEPFPTSIDLTGTALGCTVADLNQNNAGYFQGVINVISGSYNPGQVPLAPILWFALDNKIYLDLPAAEDNKGDPDVRGSYSYKSEIANGDGTYTVHYIYPTSFTSGTNFALYLPYSATLGGYLTFTAQ